MSSSPFKTKDFNKIKDKWYKKLEKSGFSDIEKDEDTLKAWHSHYFKCRNVNNFHSKQEYYILAGQFLHTHTFESRKHKAIWKAHAEGRPLSKITEEIKTRYPSTKRSEVYLIIKKLTKEMLKNADSDE